MRGIYIPGMEMPKTGEYRCIIRQWKQGEPITIDLYGKEELSGTIIPVPPHGKLIEKHDVFKLISAFPEIDKLLTVQFMQALYNLPTIIPAEGGTQKDGGQDDV